VDLFFFAEVARLLWRLYGTSNCREIHDYLLLWIQARTSLSFCEWILLFVVVWRNKRQRDVVNESLCTSRLMFLEHVRIVQASGNIDLLLLLIRAYMWQCHFAAFQTVSTLCCKSILSANNNSGSRALRRRREREVFLANEQYVQLPRNIFSICSVDVASHSAVMFVI